MYQQHSWSTSQKIGFRFIFLLFILFILPFPFSVLEMVINNYQFSVAVIDFWDWVIKGIASSILGIEELFMDPTGSGDTTADWIRNALFLTLAIAGSGLWTVLDKKRDNYYRLWRIFVMIVVYYLVYFMAVYGFIKVFWLQMPELSIHRLLNTYGQSSPMGLLWTFMGASKTYSVYAGMSEVIAGILLIFRRTRTLGGLVTFGVMFNVFMLNMAYDVPVKLFSAQLMLMGLYIALIDYKAIVGLFLTQKPKEITPWPPFFKKPSHNYILLVLEAVFIIYIFYVRIDAGLSGRKQYGELRPRAALFGLYDVEHFVKNGDTLPPLLTDDERWQRVIFDSPTLTRIVSMDDQLVAYQSEIDTTSQIVTFTIGKDSLQKTYNMDYEKLEDGLKLSGVFREDTLQLKLKTYDIKKFYLTNRGFHWINETPFHRYDPKPKENW